MPCCRRRGCRGAVREGRRGGRGQEALCRDGL